MGNEKFRNAIMRKPQAVPPIWMMRQAGRYHSHYQNLRRKHSFMELCKRPELAAEVALGPIEDFDFDVAILFSDLLFPLEALGMGLEYKDTGPELGWHLSWETLGRLAKPDAALQELLFQKEAVAATRKVLPEDKSLIGFVGGPFTLFTYAVEGSHKGSLVAVKQNLSLFPKFCEILVPLLIENIHLQFAGGAELVMLFDTAAGELSPQLYQQLVLPEIEKIAAKFPKRLGYYAKGTVPKHHQHALFASGIFAGMGVDHRWDIRDAFPLGKGFVQGNFDQALLTIDPKAFESHLKAFAQPLKQMSQAERAGWVCGLGHGVIPQAKMENVKKFVQWIREYFYE